MLTVARPAARRPRAAAPLATAALLAAALLPAALPAQAVLGIGDDALVLPRGVFRVRAIGQQGTFDERYGGISTSGRLPNQREPILQDLNIASIGTLQFPNLAPVQAGLRALTSNPNYELSLGRTEADGDVRINAGSLVAEVGLTKRLSFGAVLPFVDTRNNVQLRVNPGGQGNVGFNPALAVPEARAQNTQLVAQLFTAARRVEAAVGLGAGGCATAAIVQCQLVNGARQFAGGVAGIYGTNQIAAFNFDARPGSPFVPLGTSAEQQAIAARVAQLRAAFGAAGADITTAAPFGSPANLNVADAQRILTEQAFGVAAAQVGTTSRRGLGDVEVAAKYSLVNTFGHDDANARLDPRGVNLRTAVTGVFRLGSGLAEDPNNFLDVPTGSGANAVGVRSATDVLLGSRFWASLALRYTAPLADDQFVRVVDAPERVLAPAYRSQTVRRDLGNFFELEATPRFVLTDWLLVAGQYYFRDKAEDRYRGQFVIPQQVTGFADVTLDARTLEQETRAVEHRLGGGVSLSSVKPFQRGRAPVPAELTYTFQQTVDGFGGAVPRLTLHQVQLRLYARLFGR